jgi:hypothetical protein
MRPSMVSMPQKQLIAILLGVCVLSAGIGSGIALLAETGPAGAAGKRGPAGPEGPEGPAGPSGAEEIGALEAEVEELRSEIDGSESLEGRLEELESEISGLDGVAEELCGEVFEESC